ncbi:hypothetical protein KTAU_35350 [Thermogemmatispora aurantia]|uniref:Uncharacterized protein n=1 Tax=Thermogemmatispora aurantia TaxID=2045279 RepID=A0A5J4KEF6_9CHLR|nr:hypothetical protein KTAU_35350 [Thermogemmatispora aurantia]
MYSFFDTVDVACTLARSDYPDLMATGSQADGQIVGDDRHAPYHRRILVSHNHNTHVYRSLLGIVFAGSQAQEIATGRHRCWDRELPPRGQRLRDPTSWTGKQADRQE